MSAPNDQVDDSQIPELGDIMTLKSTVFGTITGKIIYRDEKLIRIQPFDSDDRAQNIPMGEDGDFAPVTGINEAIIHSKRLDPHFSLQLGAAVGETLEFYTFTGEVAGDNGIVVDIIANDDEDAIVLADGRRLNFSFIGPPKPIDVIGVRATGAEEEELDGEEAVPEKYDMSLFEGLLPAAMVAEIPTAERTYSETIQREEMYMDLLKDYTTSQQKNPTLLRRVARETELLLALKYAASSVNADGKTSPFIKSAKTLKDILTRLGSPLSSVIPVLAVKRILYVDTEDLGTVESALEQVEFRNWVLSELQSYRSSKAYEAGQEAGAGARVTNLMYAYLYDVLFRDGSVFMPANGYEAGTEIAADQDVLRTVVPPESVLGFSKIHGLASPENVGQIKARGARVLSSYKTGDGSVITSGDPGSALSYLVLPANVSSLWRPVKFSGSLDEDIRANTIASNLPPIEAVTNDPRSYERGLQIINNKAGEETDIQVSDWINNNLALNVHQSDLLAPVSIGVNRVLDSIGLRSYEWTPEIAEIIWAAVKKAQTTYVRSFNKFKTESEAYIKEKGPFLLGETLPGDTTLFTPTHPVPEIGAILNKLEMFDPIYGKWDLARAHLLVSLFEGTLARVLYASTSVSEPHPYTEELRKTYLSEVQRSLLQMTAMNNSLAKYKAEPVINKCPHVKDVERLRSLMMRDETKFLASLQKLLHVYQGDRKDNWVQCKVCDTHLICVHELMKFYEKTHPGRAPALNKEILLDFGGAAFNGRYVCRNCGIPIAEFEYDNHLEYDDEGKPLVGRNVVEEGKMPVEDELGQILDMALHKKGITFENPIQKQLYDIICVMSLNAGFSLGEANYQKIVEQVFLYETTKIPNEEQFIAMYAKKKVKPEYRSFKASLQISVVATYLICEIHTLNPLPEMLFPFLGCDFRRGGFPIDSDDPADTGAMDYFVCVIANLNRDAAPWNLSNWSQESSPAERQKRVRDFIMRMFGDPDLQVMLQQAKHTYMDNKRLVSGRASQNDKIPGDYRPVNNLKRPEMAEVLTIPEKLMEAALSGPIQEVDAMVSNRAKQLAISGVLEAHEFSERTGLISETSPRSESTCCFIPLNTARSGAFAVFSSEATQKEVDGLRNAEAIIHKRDPCAQSNGSHLWVGWKPPVPIASIAVAPDTSYFKMFLRSCWRGSRSGELHEFGRRSANYECRHCKFALAVDPLVLMSDLNEEEVYNNDTKRKGAIKTVVAERARTFLTESGVTVDSESFNNLLGIVSRKQTVSQYAVPVKSDPQAIFANLDRLISEDFQFMPVRMTDWELVRGIMAENFTRAAEVTEGVRKTAWGPFVTRYDNLKLGLLDILDGRQGRVPVRKINKELEAILDAVERIAAEPIYQGPAEINKHWIVSLERIAVGFSEMVFSGGSWFGLPMDTKRWRKGLFNGTKWFGKKMSGRHMTKFESMITSILGFTADTNAALSNEALREPSSILLKRMAGWLGKINTFWASAIVSMTVYGVTTEELSYILKWLVMSSMESILTTLSPVYAHVGSDATSLKIQTILLAWVKANMLEARRQYDIFGMSDKEVEMAILDAREKEKISIIKEIDDEKDPDMRAVTLMQKNLKMGRWGVGAKKSGAYNTEYWDFLQDQRDRIGVVEGGGGAAPAQENAIGFDFGAAPEADRRYETYAPEAEDAY